MQRSPSPSHRTRSPSPQRHSFRRGHAGRHHPDDSPSARLLDVAAAAPASGSLLPPERSSIRSLRPHRGARTAVYNRAATRSDTATAAADRVNASRFAALRCRCGTQLACCQCAESACRVGDGSVTRRCVCRRNERYELAAHTHALADQSATGTRAHAAALCVDGRWSRGERTA